MAQHSAAHGDLVLSPAPVPELARGIFDRIRALLEEAGGQVSPHDPRRSLRLVDTAIALLSEHLAAYTLAVLPVARDRLGASVVAEQLHRVRESEWAMRDVEAHYAGEAHSLRRQRGWPELVAALGDAAAAQDETELALLDRLWAQLNDAERDRLVGDFTAELQRAPTRPHPHAPLRGRRARLALHLAAAWDRAFDAMDARHVPHPRRRHTPGQLSRWGAYLVGQPLPPQQERDEARG